MDLDDETANGKRRLIGERVIDGFRSHVTREYTSIGGETSDNYTDMVIDFEDRSIDFLTLLSQSDSASVTIDVDEEFRVVLQFVIHLNREKKKSPLLPFSSPAFPSLANGRGTAPIGSRCRGLSRACFFSRTVASGRGFGLSWTQAELRLRTLITDRERLKLSLIGVCKPERKQEQFRVLQD
ncbi:hypothetical protein F2Q69_00046180 [Brassica cretica]|uniref:Uncharacterized protein n=1 Tax=Brassica cretica TaxID=69181 RepID=A0A8S9PEN7_BRACR|nr:hypothetical protein F2Q69_00046180 [Brassica cretica]